MTDPDGNVQVHTYEYITDSSNRVSSTEYEKSVAYKDSSGNVLRTVTNTYVGDPDPNSNLLINGRVTAE